MVVPPDVWAKKNIIDQTTRVIKSVLRHQPPFSVYITVHVHIHIQKSTTWHLSSEHFTLSSSKCCISCSGALLWRKKSDTLRQPRKEMAYAVINKDRMKFHCQKVQWYSVELKPFTWSTLVLCVVSPPPSTVLCNITLGIALRQHIYVYYRGSSRRISLHCCYNSYIITMLGLF